MLIMFAILTASCNSPSSQLIGKWSDHSQSGEYLEFFKDNTYFMNSKKMPLSGKWKELDDGRIMISIESFGVTQSFMGKIENNKLKLQMQGNEYILNKIE
jgi:hypothetical protein